MQVLSRCPLQVGSVVWLPPRGGYVLTVVCKATFQLAPELSPLADAQDAVIAADSYVDNDPSKSLRFASDLVPYKKQPEVLLVGHAYAPSGTQVSRLSTRLTVAEVDKAVEVVGDRHFKLDESLTPAARFGQMPLSWERAAGGPDTSNPVGVPMGSEARADGWGRVIVPNLVPQGRMIAYREDVVAPVGYGPIAPHWPGRLLRLNHYAPFFQANPWNSRPLPPDLDPGYFNAAPQDQLLRELAGTERFTLENLVPTHPLFTTRLAGVVPHVHVELPGSSTFEIQIACDTLVIDTDRCVATLVFRGSMGIDHPDRPGWAVVTMDQQAAAPGVPEVTQSFADSADLDNAETFVSENRKPPPHVEEIPPPGGIDFDPTADADP